MTTFDETLHPRGHASNAGAFSDKPQTAAEITLELERDWGTLTIAEGSRTPWGSADSVTEMAPGVVSVSTPGHGGIKLSKERNAIIPPALRRTWYEEDCEVNIVGMYHPDVFSGSTTQESFEKSVKYWFPNEYEAATGNTVTAEESDTRAREIWAKNHEDEFVVTHKSRTEEQPGLARVTATKASSGETRDFLVPVDEQYAPDTELGTGYRFLIDESRHQVIASKPAPVLVPAPKYTGIGEAKTEAGRVLLERDLRKRWRDGTRVRSLDQIIEEGITGKTAYVENGKRTYALLEREHVGSGNSKSMQVSKATFDAVEAPDERTQVGIDQQAAELARHAFDHRGYGVDETRRLKARVVAAEAKADSSRAAARAAADEERERAGIEKLGREGRI